jgi:hypothetical protein
VECGLRMEEDILRRGIMDEAIQLAIEMSEAN